MQDTPYQQKMDQLGLQEHNLFEIAYNKIVHFTSVLTALYGVESILDERSFLLRSIKRMTNLMKSVYVLFETISDRASMMILTRSIIDINAIICFLFDYVRDDDERALRLLLFYLDGVQSRLKLSEEPMKKRDPNYISEEEYNATLAQKEEARKADYSAVKEIEKRIQDSPLYLQIHPTIFKKAYWKYKKIDADQTYSWKELYEIANGDKSVAIFEQVFLSHYVHGVAISDIQFPSINETNPVFALNICCTILNHLDSIFEKWFPGEYKELEESNKQVLGKTLIETMTPESLEAYLKRIEKHGCGDERYRES